MSSKDFIDETEIERMLSDFNITGFEAKVYLALLKNGEMTLPELSKVLGKHRPQVYMTLSRLVEKGWVEKQSGKPSYFRAVDPKIILNTMRKEIEEKIKYLEERLYDIYSGPSETTKGVWVLRSFKGLMSRAESIIESARKDLIISGNTTFIRRLWPKIEEATKRGINVFIMLFTFRGEKLLISEIMRFNKVKRAISGDFIVLADSKIAVVMKQRRKYETITYGLVIEEPTVIDYILHDFFYRWSRSRVIVDRPILLPTCFTMHRFAIIEARRLIRSGKKLGARVNGIDIETGEGITVDGVIEKCLLSIKTGLANIKLRTKHGTILVGGPDAVVEDIAAREICLYEIS